VVVALVQFAVCASPFLDVDHLLYSTSRSHQRSVGDQKRSVNFGAHREEPLELLFGEINITPNICVQT